MATLNARWKLDEVSGTTASDVSGNGLNGSFVNAPVWTGGKWNNCLDFDGVDDKISVAYNALLKPANLSMSFWAYIDAWPTVACRLIDNGMDNNKGFMVQMSSGYGYNNKIQYVLAAPGYYSTGPATPVLSLSTWYFIVITFNNTTKLAKIFTNAVGGDSITTSGSISYDTSTFVMAGSAAVNSRCYNGKLDDVRVYNGILTQEEITNLYLYNQELPLLCWNYKARYKNSDRMFAANGSGPYPKQLKVPSSVDINSGIMMDEGKLINPNQYKII